MAAVCADLLARRVLLRMLAVIGLTLGVVGFAPAAPSQAAPCNGVTVVVQFGGSTSVRCAPGSHASALAALRAAGHSPQRAQMQPGYFLCRIDGRPSVSADPCMRTSPESAYWAFYTGRPGQGWTYASTGVASQSAPAGSWIGFAFGAGARPSVQPSVPSTPKPTATPKPTSTPRPTSSPKPTSTSRPTSPAQPSATTGGSGAKPSSSRAAGGSGSSASQGATSPAGSNSTPSSTSAGAVNSSKAQSSGASGTSPSSSTATSVTATASAAGVRTTGAGSANAQQTNAAAVPAEGSNSGGGTNIGLIVGGGSIAVLAAGAGIASIRRRPQE